MSDKNSVNIMKQFEQADFNGSSTKPLYFSKVTIEGDNSLSPLSDSFYKAILGRALKNPLQNVDSSLGTFQDIQKSFLYTGLYQDVTVSFEKDLDGASLEYLRRNVPREYGIELPIPTHAKVLLKPAALYTNNAATTTLNDDSASVALCRTWMNQLGFADSEMLYCGMKYNSAKAEWDGISCKGFFSVPLTKNPSIKGLVDFGYSESSDLSNGHDVSKKEYERMASMGFKKSWILNNSKNIPTFYTGLTLTNRFSKEQKDSRIIGNFLKTGITSQFCHDTRKFFGTLPISGHLLRLNNEYVLSQANMDSFEDSIGSNFNKLRLNLEHHASFFKNMLIRSVDLQVGSIVPLGDIDKINAADRFSLGGTNLLKGFQSSGSSQTDNIYYKMGLQSSHKFFNVPLDSPLRLNFFLNVGNSFDDFTKAFDSYAAATGASLIYKTPQADMDLTYAYPLTSRPQDVSKPGFSFGIKFSYF